MRTKNRSADVVDHGIQYRWVAENGISGYYLSRKVNSVRVYPPLIEGAGWRVHYVEGNDVQLEATFMSHRDDRSAERQAFDCAYVWVYKDWNH